MRVIHVTLKLIWIVISVLLFIVLWFFRKALSKYENRAYEHVARKVKDAYTKPVAEPVYVYAYRTYPSALEATYTER